MAALRSAGVPSTSAASWLLAAPAASSSQPPRLPPPRPPPRAQGLTGFLLAWSCTSQRLQRGGSRCGGVRKPCVVVVRSSARVGGHLSARATAASEPPAYPPPASQLEDLQGRAVSPIDDAADGEGLDAEGGDTEGGGDAEARARKAASKRLMARLRGARFCRDVAEASRDAAETGGLDDIGASFALSCLSKLRSGVGGEEEAIGEAVERLEAHVLDNIGRYRARSLATALHALAKLGALAAEVADAGVAAVCRRSADFKPQEVSMLLWAYSKMGAKDGVRYGRLYDALGRQVVNKAELFKPQELATTLWAYATVGLRPRTLLMTVEQEAVEKLRHFKWQEVANSVWAFSTLGLRAPELLDAVQERLLREPPSRLQPLNSCDISMLGSAFSQSSRGSARLYDTLAEQAQRCAPSFSPLETATYLSACARAGQLHPSLIATFAPHLTAASEQLGVREVSMLLWALATAGHKECAALVAVLNAAAKRHESELCARDVSMLAWAQAKLSFQRDPELLAMLATRAEGCKGTFAPLDIALLMWAAASVRLESNRLFEALSSNVIAAAPSLAPPNLAMVAWAYGTTAPPTGAPRDSAYPVVMASLRPYAVAAAPSLSSQGLVMTAVGFARAKAYFPDVFASIELQALSRPEALSCQGLTSLLLAFAMVQDPGVGLFDVLEKEASRRIGAFTSRELVNVLWSYARVDRPAPDLFALAEPLLLRNAGGLTPVDVSRLAYACVAVGYESAALFAAMQARMEANLRSFRAHELSATLKSFLRAGVVAMPLYRAIAGDREVVEKLTPRNLASIVWAAAHVERTQPELVLELQPRMLAVASEFSGQRAATVVYAYAKLFGKMVPGSVVEVFAGVLAAKAEAGRLTTKDAELCREAYDMCGARELEWCEVFLSNGDEGGGEETGLVGKGGVEVADGEEHSSSGGGEALGR